MKFLLLWTNLPFMATPILFLIHVVYGWPLSLFSDENAVCYMIQLNRIELRIKMCNSNKMLYPLSKCLYVLIIFDFLLKIHFSLQKKSKSKFMATFGKKNLPLQRILSESGNANEEFSKISYETKYHLHMNYC